MSHSLSQMASGRSFVQLERYAVTRNSTSAFPTVKGGKAQ
jgi:hypothetical protein